MMRQTILQGDVLDGLATLPDESVQCCVTYPPYWGLRDYGVAGQLGLEPEHDCLGWATGAPCGECYVCRLLAVFREVHRVLKSDGTLWLNLGDTYASRASAGSGAQGKTGQRADRRHTQRKLLGRVGPSCKNPPASDVEAAPHRKRRVSATRLEGCGANQAAALRADEAGRIGTGLKPKELAGIPWRLALALQASGWWLRAEIVWQKLQPMPESTTDRPTRAHEQVFLLSKSASYYYDAEAAREATAGNARMQGRVAGWATGQGAHTAVDHARPGGSANGAKFAGDRGGSRTGDLATRNWRTVWALPSEPYKGAHFATFPSELARRCIVAGSRPGDTVLDPFLGTGTTLMVAARHERDGVGIELNPDSVEQAVERIGADGIGLMFSTLSVRNIQKERVA